MRPCGRPIAEYESVSPAESVAVDESETLDPEDKERLLGTVSRILGRVTTKVNVFFPVRFAGFFAVTMTVVDPGTVGVPVMAPVCEFKTRPAGSEVDEKVSAAPPASNAWAMPL